MVNVRKINREELGGFLNKLVVIVYEEVPGKHNYRLVSGSLRRVHENGVEVQNSVSITLELNRCLDSKRVGKLWGFLRSDAIQVAPLNFQLQGLYGKPAEFYVVMD